MKAAHDAVCGVRSVELAVSDLERAEHFYTEVWGLTEVALDGASKHFRGTGTEHHILTLTRSETPGLLSVHLAAPDEEAVRRLHAKAKAAGAAGLSAPAALARAAGGGFGFELRTPEGLLLHVSSDVRSHAVRHRDTSKPTKLSHAVINSADVMKQRAFFIDVLGFRLSDSTSRQEFLRCGPDHHSLALTHAERLSLNHMAFEMDNIDGLMRGCGRLLKNGYGIEWGVGRHGPGNNVFAYFIDPNGFVPEYTTEVDQIDEATHIAQTPEYWASFPMRPCRWGLANKIPERLQQAMSGKLPPSAQSVATR